MKLAEFAYERPTNLASALALISDQSRDIRVLAGGQSLLAALNFRLGEPDILVDLNRIPDLSGISESDASVRIGPMTRHGEILSSDLIANHLPLISRAMQDVAHPAIRNRGTFGGSIALADPAAEMPACLLAYNGRIAVASATGKRQLRADDYFRGLYETALEPGEIITAVEFDKPPKNSFFAFLEFARRKGDFATAGVAIAGHGDRNVDAIRVVLFGVSDRPVRASATENALTGHSITEEAIDAAVPLAMEGLSIFGDGQSSETMKRHLSRTLLTRALASLATQRHAT